MAPTPPLLCRDGPARSRPPAAERERRLEKLRELTGAGPAAYPYRYPTDSSVADVRAASGGLAPDVRTRQRVRIAGRVDLLRPQGWLSFALLRDRTGAIPLYADRTVLDPDWYRAFDDLDRGDWIGVEGSNDAGPLAAARELAPLAQRAGISTCLVVVPGGEHSFTVWSGAFRASLPFLAARLGMVRQTAGMTSGCTGPS